MQARKTNRKSPLGKNFSHRRWHQGNQSVSRGRRWGKSTRRYDGTSGVPEFKNGAITGAFSRLFNDTIQDKINSNSSSASNSSNEVQIPQKVKNGLEVILGENVDSVKVFEDSTFARLHGATATTRVDRIYLSISGQTFINRPELVLHEYYHVIKQWNPGDLTVPKYLWENATNGNGYAGNKYEIEAKSFATKNLNNFKQLIK